MDTNGRSNPFVPLLVLVVIFVAAVELDRWFPPKGPSRERRNVTPRSRTNGLGMVFLWIPAGEFLMGSPADEVRRDPWEGPRHRVRFQRGFWMSRHEVTQDQYQRIMKGNPSTHVGPRRPVEGVSWYEAQQFLQRLSEHEKVVHRLPSEAEWEYACRAGSMTPFAFGSSITADQVNFDGNYPYPYAKGAATTRYRRTTVDVGTFSANDFGLYDLHGNVAEWCEDAFHGSYDGAPADGSPWTTANDDIAVIRGGGWNAFARSCRSAHRWPLHRGLSFPYLGFRVVIDGGEDEPLSLKAGNRR